MSVADKLLQVNQVKQDIKTAIETKGVPMTNVAFTEYANKILDISGGDGGNGGGWDISYEEYALALYYRFGKLAIFENAWEHSLTVDPSEISANSLSSSSRGTAQYPNGETEGVIIPQGVTSIGNGAFRYWTSNNQPLVIPDSVTSIGTQAFRNWRANTHPLIIPNSVTSIGTYAFQYWLLVPYVEIRAITPPTLTNASAFNNQNNAPIYVPNGSVEAYKAATNWVDLADRIFPIYTTQTFEWQFVGSYSSEPYNPDLLIDALINGYYEQGLHYLNTNYPAGDYQEGFVAVVYDQSTYNYFEYVVVVALELECYLISQYDYNSKEHRLDVTVPEGFTEIDVMYAFKTQHPQYYETLSSVNYHMFGVRANNGYAYSDWALRPK